MAKYLPTATNDAELDLIATATELVVCSTQPTTYAEAHTTYMLANHVMSAGDFAKAAGDTSGRKVTVAAQSGISITNSGTAQHVALTITASSTLLLVTTCTSQALTAGGTVDVPAFKFEAQAPS